MDQLALFENNFIEPVQVKKQSKIKKSVNKNRKTIEEFFKFRATNYDSLLSYPDNSLKKLHGKRGKKAFKCLAEELGLKEYDVSYNPSGMIDAGYITLIGMWNENNGIYISLSASGFGLNFLYRTVSHMKDWTGGSNHFLEENMLFEDYNKALDMLLRLKSTIN